MHKTSPLHVCRLDREQHATMASLLENDININNLRRRQHRSSCRAIIVAVVCVLQILSRLEYTQARFETRQWQSSSSSLISPTILSSRYVSTTDAANRRNRKHSNSNNYVSQPVTLTAKTTIVPTLHVANNLDSPTSTAAEEHNDKTDGYDDSIVAVPFIRYSQPEEFHRIRTATYAYSQQTKRHHLYPESNSDYDELDHLESLIVPCLTTTTSKAPTSGASSSILPPSFTDPYKVSTVVPRNDNSKPRTATTDDEGVEEFLPQRRLAFWENMICGAISRSVAQTIMHPANTMKTILQNSRGGRAVGSAVASPTFVQLLAPKHLPRLWVGAGANFLLSVPHGAVNFAVLEFIRKNLSDLVDKNAFLSKRKEKLGAGLDFTSSALSTIACSVVSTPQMMITDNIMAGNYPNLVAAIQGLARQRGIAGFYTGWWPGLAGKIPSYALTWTIFQQLKRVRDRMSDRPANDIENAIMGCIASATTVSIMIPIDTIKTRLVTQHSRIGTEVAYKGIVDCAMRIAKEEGIKTFYRGLPPRLVSVVPMIGIQFGVYEAMKKLLLKRKIAASAVPTTRIIDDNDRNRNDDVVVYTREQILEEAAMEVAASPEHPYPAPLFLQRAHMEVINESKQDIPIVIMNDLPKTAKKTLLHRQR